MEHVRYFQQEEEERDIPANTGTEYPCDWNIKSKVRFFSENAFDWCWPIKSRDESSGFHSFIHSDSFSNVSYKCIGSHLCCVFSLIRIY